MFEDCQSRCECDRERKTKRTTLVNKPVNRLTKQYFIAKQLDLYQHYIARLSCTGTSIDLRSSLSVIRSRR